MLNNISVTILTKNSSTHIKECLSALADFSEIIILDNGSTDNTLEIAKSFINVKIFKHEFIGFGPLKILATEYASNNWVLSIDSDEILTREMLNELKQLNKTDNTVYSFKRLNHYNGRIIKGCGWYPDTVKRLFNKKITNFNTNMVHESVITERHNKITLDSFLKHYSYISISDLIQKMDKYTELYANANIGKKTGYLKPFLSGMSMFVKTFFIKKGFMYGRDGFVISLCNSLGAFFKHFKLIEKNKNISVSLIITTYNSPEYLEKVLLSVFAQKVLPNEIVIADDGSTQDTANMVNKIREISPVRIIHSWNEDNGFRAAQSRNIAFVKSSGEYVIFIDGDIILHELFIHDHIKNSNKNTIIYGRRVFLNDYLTNKTLNESFHNISFFDNGIKNRFKAIRCGLLSKFLSKKMSTSKGFQTCNFSFFRDDFIRINGFNNNFVGWGLEDTEFCERVLNSNIQLKKMKFTMINYHLHHNENPREHLQNNKDILDNTISEKSKYCVNGVNKCL